MALLMCCAPKLPVETTYMSPISATVDQVSSEDDGVTVVLGVVNRSSSMIILDTVDIDVSGDSTTMGFNLSLPGDTVNPIRLFVPTKQSRDQVKISGMVSSQGGEHIAVFHRTIDLAGADHHH